MSFNHLNGIRAVVFDAVGTLLEPDPTPALVYSEIGSRYGTKLTKAEIASGFREAFDAQEQNDVANGLATDETRERERWRAIVGSVLHDAADIDLCFQELWQHFAHTTNWKLATGTGELLANFAQRNLRLAVASNFDTRLARCWQAFPKVACCTISSSAVKWVGGNRLRNSSLLSAGAWSVPRTKSFSLGTIERTIMTVPERPD